MKWKQTLRSVFPKPPQRVTWAAALPLILFLVAYAVLCFVLEWRHVLLYANPVAFCLMGVTVWVWWIHICGLSGLSRRRQMFAFLTRMCLVGILVLVLAEPRSVRRQDALAVVYLVDVSDSIGDGTSSEAFRFIAETASKKPVKDKVGIVVFGRHAAVELPPRVTLPFDEGVTFNSLIDRDATNLEEALSLAAAMIPEDHQGRIVLMSDGTETEGNLSDVVDQLTAREISIDVMPIEYNHENEVWLERLELPEHVNIGENYQAAVILSSLKKGSGKLTLLENGNAIFEDQVDFEAGKNRYVVPIYLREAGYYEYTARIDTTSDMDNLRENNEALNYLYLAGEGRILLVNDPQGDPRDSETLARAIRESKRALDVVTAYDVPRDAMSLMPYDCVIFNNVAADLFDTIQLEAVKDAARNFGIGFLMVGGPNSYGPGGYHRSAIEEALPVTMDITKKKVLPKGALAIILHTCEFADGNTWGKRITKQAIKVLGARDEAGVLAYTQNGEEWVFELSPVAELDMMLRKISGAQIGDMPSFARTMQLGLKGLKASDASAKHMIIISDGDPGPPSKALIDEYRAAGVSVSMVAIFPHGGQDISTMRRVAAVTGGRYYFPASPAELPSIFIKESKTLKRSMIQNKTITPELENDLDGVLKGIDAMPQLRGYVLTTAKNDHSVRTILKAPNEDDELEPILSIWRYGLSTTAAFTSDLSPNWAADWMDWDKYRTFVEQLLTRISRVDKTGNLRLRSFSSGSQGVLQVEDFHKDETFLEVHAVVSGPDGIEESLPLKQVGPRRYQATIPLRAKGRYQVRAIGVGEGRKDEAHGGFLVPYSPEYLRFRSNPTVLNSLSRKTAGENLADQKDPVKTIYETRRKPRMSSLPIFLWFLIALACLIPLDVAIRRIQIDMYVIKGLLGLNKTGGASGQLMGALLERKRAVGTALDSQRATTTTSLRPQSQSRSTTAARQAARKPDSVSKPPEQETSPDNMSTTERLLRMKRQRSDDEEQT